MDKWKINLVGKKPKLTNAVLIEGLPGIGNVGKVAVDFMIDNLKAKKIYDIFSYKFPHSVFVNEKNLVSLPSISLYYKRLGNRDVLLLAGDIQPTDEESCYEFSDKILDIFQGLNGKEIVTLGGIGLEEIPKTPKVYCTGNSKEMIKRYKEGLKMKSDLYGVVGPIVGVSGLLVGLANRRKIDAIALLAETYSHPLYLGVKGAREVIKILNKKVGLGVDLKELDGEIEDIEKEMIKRTKDLEDVSKKSALNKLKGKFGEEANYIG